MRLATARDLAILVRNRRRERGMSQEELARAVGVTRQWIIGLEKGRVRAFGLVLRTLAALGLAIDVVDDKKGIRRGAMVDLDQHLSQYGERHP